MQVTRQNYAEKMHILGDICMRMSLNFHVDFLKTQMHVEIEKLKTEEVKWGIGQHAPASPSPPMPLGTLSLY